MEVFAQADYGVDRGKRRAGLAVSEKLIAYVVTAGSYSDYRILNIFLDKEEAEKYRENYDKKSHGPYTDADVEEYEIQEKAEGVVPVLSLRYSANAPYERTPYKEVEGYVWESQALPITLAHTAPPTTTGFMVLVEGCDFTAVRKAFSERLVQARDEYGE